MRIVGTILIIALGLSGCFSDTVTDRYASLADARADRLFERGWLPDILPSSAIRIRTSNNLDLNISTGEFSFTPADAPSLFRTLVPGAKTDAPFDAWADTVDDYADRGFSAWSYEDSDTKWVFFCRAAKGTCDYFSWLG